MKIHYILILISCVAFIDQMASHRAWTLTRMRYQIRETVVAQCCAAAVPSVDVV